MANTFYSLNILSGNYRMEVGVDTLTGNYSLIFPSDAPNNDQILKWSSTLNKFTWAPYQAGGGGSLSSVGLNLSTELDTLLTVSNSPLTANGAIALDLDSQAANRVLASPNGTAGKPTFRALVDNDLPAAISAAKISGVLNKNNIPNGTQASSFQLANGYSIVTDTAGIKIVAADGATVGDLICNNLHISGQISQSNVTELNVDDEWINLLNGFTTGVPTLNGGIKLRRGSQLWSHIEWVEASKRWKIGLSDNLKSVARFAFVEITNANVSANSYTFKHDLNAEKYPDVKVINNVGVEICLNVTHTDLNNCVIRFDRVGAITGTWTITATAG